MSEPLHPNQLQPGHCVGTYRIVRRLGVGGFSFVFQMERTGERYVMKMAAQPVSDADPDNVDGWIRREASSLEHLKHPNLLPVYEVGRWPDTRTGYSFYVTEYVEGDTFHVWRRRTRATLYEWVGVLCQVLRALEAVHARGMVQRDFKADNVVVRTADAHPFLIDFGSVYVPSARPLTEGVAPGTVYCMPPEVIAFAFSEPARQKDARFEARPFADLYGVGCLLYECLTERRPFDPKLPLDQLLLRILTTPPPDPRQLAPEAPASLVALTLRLLEKDPELRPSSARAVRRELERLCDEEGHTAPWQRPSQPADQPGAEELLSAVEKSLVVLPEPEPELRKEPAPEPERPAAATTPESGPEEGGKCKDMRTAGRWRSRWGALALGLAVLGLVWTLCRVEWGPEVSRAFLRAESTAPVQPAPHAERGPPVSSRHNAAQMTSSQEPSRLCTLLSAVLGMSMAQLAGCATTPPVREPALDPISFLENCPTEARMTPRLLGFRTRSEGPDYYWYATYIESGTPASEEPVEEGGPINLRSGPMRATMVPLTGEERVEYIVEGEAVVTPLRVYAHLHRIQLPDGSWRPICGVGSEPFDQEWGFPTYEAEKDVVIWGAPLSLTRVDRSPGSVVLSKPMFMTFIQPGDERVRPRFLKMPPPERR